MLVETLLVTNLLLAPAYAEVDCDQARQAPSTEQYTGLRYRYVGDAPQIPQKLFGRIAQQTGRIRWYYWRSPNTKIKGAGQCLIA